eukprot:TRINITY_DN176_c0_g3_i2.p2 TRINITY_DN176_c0_g3~~TRINITY_DN176_c0_g3_i2.p2  ORF type:complete len:451 (+),score=164.86 TRINITY_DN176_c0_g3_i2:95-1354(+)
MSFDSSKLVELRGFIALLQQRKELLWHPSLDFFREALESLGCKLPERPAEPQPAAACQQPPPAAAGAAPAAPPESPQGAGGAGGDGSRKRKREEPEPASEPESEEEPIPPYPTEVDADGELWEAEPEAATADQDVAVEDGREYGETERDGAMTLRGEAAELAAAGDRDGAVAKLTAALRLHPRIAPLWAARADLNLKARRPTRALSDCAAALALNPDQAKALRVRGQAQRRLGKWEEAAADLRKANSIDFDPDLGEVLKEVEKRANRIREWRMAKDRIERERERKQRRRELLARQKELRAQRKREQEEQEEEERRQREEFPELEEQLLQDPDVKRAVQAALRGDKATAMAMCQENPKVFQVLQMLGIVRVAQADGTPLGHAPPFGAAPPAGREPGGAPPQPAPAARSSEPTMPTYEDLD